MADKRANPDRLIARTAARQHGVISTAQLVACGLSPSTIADRVAAGRLHRIHRGVYAVGHPGLAEPGRWKAATLALGEAAVLSHRSAAELWAMLPEGGGLPQVSVPGDGGRRRRTGIRVFRSVSLTAAMTTSHEGIAVTMPARTLADLRRSGSAWEVRRARRQAEYLDLPLGDERHSDRTRSDLERDLLALLRRGGVPQPEVNVRIGPYTVDLLWREARLVVESDGWAAHRGWQSFQDDRIRDAYLARIGLRVQRFSDWQIDNQPDTVVATVWARLSER